MSSEYELLNIGGAEVRLGRTPDGVAELWAEDDQQLAAGLGYAHAQDRFVQIMLFRLAAQGRICEFLKDDDDMLRMDVGARVIGFAHHARQEVPRCTPAALQFAEMYCAGVNHYLEHHRAPLTLKLLGYQPEPWTTADVLLVLKVMTYVGLAQGQHELEKVLIQSIQAGTSVEMLQRIFRPHLDGLDEGLVELVRQVRIWQGALPAGLRFLGGISQYSASNNWAISAARSASGHALECHDPHVECNHLPQMWYECVLHTPHDYRIGITAPGVPGMQMGRNRAVSLSFTYGFMDSIDYFIDECRGKEYRRENQWQAWDQRSETIVRKSHEPLEIFIRDTDCGTLECDPTRDVVPDGQYLTLAWTSQRAGAAESLDALYRVQSAALAGDALALCGQMAMSGNWIAADREGNIGYQQSGRLPRRRHSGLYPLPAWQDANRWQGLVAAEELDHRFNPPEGFIATANHDCNPAQGPLAVNMSMGPDRINRIEDLLKEKPQFTLDDMKCMQADLKSLQAAGFMELLRPLLSPADPTARVLLDWDCRYDVDCQGATLFEAVYQDILRAVFGQRLFGLEAWDALANQTMILTVFFHAFDRVILEAESADEERWFGPLGREGLLREVLGRTLPANPVDKIAKWGDARDVRLIHLPLGEAFPKLPILNPGPIALEGGRSTIVQGQVIELHGRVHAVGPSYRYVTDLGNDHAETALAGGASEWPLSPFYANDLERWLRHEYKILSGVPPTTEGNA